MDFSHRDLESNSNLTPGPPMLGAQSLSLPLYRIGCVYGHHLFGQKLHYFGFQLVALLPSQSAS